MKPDGVPTLAPRPPDRAPSKGVNERPGCCAVIISHSRNFVLLAPWKCASQTCHKRLAPYNESPYQRFFHFNPALGRVVHQHVTLADLMALPEGQMGLRIAAFVRNPYDRAYSGFLQVQRDAKTQPKVALTPVWVGDLIRAQIAENMARIIAAGYDFDRWIAALPAYEIHEAGRNSSLPLHPACYWTSLPDRQADFIGRVETFEEDFTLFCEEVGIDVPAAVNENVSPGQPRVSNGLSRYAWRMSRATLDRINDLFAVDFDLFGYERL